VGSAGASGREEKRRAQGTVDTRGERCPEDHADFFSVYGVEKTSLGHEEDYALFDYPSKAAAESHARLLNAQLVTPEVL